MGATLITNIGELTTNVAADGDPCGTLTDAAVLIEGSRIAWVGPAPRLPRASAHGETASVHRDSAYDRSLAARMRSRAKAEGEREVVDAGGRAVIPGFVDSHTHLVFGGDRADEFEARMAGTPYAAGGIRRTVAATRAATDDELRARLAGFVAELRAQGTTTFEVKTGYGLTVARRGAARAARRRGHARGHVPRRPRRAGGVRRPPRRLRRPRLRRDARAPARRTAAGSTSSASAARSTPTRASASSRRASRTGCSPACTATSSAPARACGSRSRWARHPSITAPISTTRMSPRSPARTRSRRCCRASSSRRVSRTPTRDGCIDAGVTVALASDCNPGSSFTSSMPLMIALAVREMGMTTAEAVWAATAGGARALRRDDVGAIAPGKRADLVLLDAPTRTHLAYRPGVPLIARVWKDGIAG